MVLNEKFHKKHFIHYYYFGSTSGFDIEKSEFGFAYLTTNYYKALYYAVGRNHKIKKNSVIYKVKLRQGMNIFNIDNTRDVKKLKKYLDKDSKELMFKSIYIRTDWSSLYIKENLNDMKQLFNILKDLGYDGIFSDDYYDNRHRWYPFFCIWNIDKLDIFDEVESNDIKSMSDYIELKKDELLSWNDKVFLELKRKKSKDDIYRKYNIESIFENGHTQSSTLRFITFTEEEMGNIIDTMDVDTYAVDRLNNGPYDTFYEIIKNDGKLFYGSSTKDFITYW